MTLIIEFFHDKCAIVIPKHIQVFEPVSPESVHFGNYLKNQRHTMSIAP